MKSFKILIFFLVVVGSVSATIQAQTVLNYTNGTRAFALGVPDPQGVSRMGMIFTNPNTQPCTLTSVSVMLANVAGIPRDTVGDLHVQIHSVNVDGIPIGVLFDTTIANSSFVSGFFGKPNVLVNIDVSSANLQFPPFGQWVVSATTKPGPGSQQDTLRLVGDDGANPTNRWLELGANGWYNASCCNSPVVNLHIYSTIGSAAPNRPPKFVPVGDKIVDEGATLNFGVNATDPDGDFVTVSMISPDLPATATFQQIANLSGAGVFDWETSFLDAGVYHATFRAEDGLGGVDLDSITITVNNINRPPVLKATPDQIIAENASLSFTITANDVDGDAIALSMASIDLPAAAIFIDNGGGFGSFDWNTNYFDAGNYTAVFRASDGNGGIDEDTVAITVNNVARPPIINPTPDKFVDEGETLSFTVTAIDSDNDPILMGMVSSDLPPAASFSQDSRSTASGTFNWPTTFSDAGTYTAIFGAFDGKTLVTDTITITVNNVNRAPSFKPTSDMDVDENNNLNFNVSATDLDGDPLILTMSSSSLPAAATLTDGGDGVGNFSWTPSFDDASTYIVVFRADDGNGGIALDSVQITVHNVNRPPEFKPAPDQNVDENSELNFIVTFTDPDDQQITLNFSSPNLPADVNFEDFGNGSGQFIWTPTFGDAGIYHAIFTASDGAGGLAVDTVEITVFNVNNSPVLDSIGDKFVDENGTLHFYITASDIDNNAIFMELVDTDLPDDYVFRQASTKTSFQTYEFLWTPNFDESGKYTATFVAFDEGLADSETISITVNNVDRAPVLVPLTGEAINEGDSIARFVVASDEDNDSITMQSTYLPPGASFLPLGAKTTYQIYQLSWRPTFNDAGQYTTTIIASDGTLADSETVTLTVNNVNRPPVLDSIGDKVINEGEILSFRVLANDPDPDDVAFSMIAPTLPPGATFQDDGDVDRGDFYWNTTFDDAGNYSVIFRADDGFGGIDEDTITITVNNVNRPPEFEIIGGPEVNEGQTLSFVISGTDADGDSLSYFRESDNIPSPYIFNDSGNGHAYFEWTPTYDEAGHYDLLIYLNDNHGQYVEINIAITVFNSNRPPVFDSIGNKEVDEGEFLSFTVYANDPDGDFPILSMIAPGLPTSAMFNPDGDVPRADFSWLTSSDDVGVYTVVFRADDELGGIDEDTITITVNSVNQPPVFNELVDRETNENENLNFLVDASDPDQDPITLIMTSSDLPLAAVFTDSGGGRGYFNWNPTYSDAGIYKAIFTADDGNSGTTVDTITITVFNVNRPPVLDSIPDAFVNENVHLHITVTSSDADGDFVSLFMTRTNLPSGAVFTDNDDGVATGTLDWTPGYNDAGVYIAVIRAVDSYDAFDEDTVQITVNNVNRAPVIEPIGDQFIGEGNTLTFIVTSSDADNDGINLYMTDTNLPGAATFQINATKDSYLSGTFNWATTFGDAGTYTATFVASDGQQADSETINIVVSNVQCYDLDVSEFTLDGPQMISFDRFFQSRLNLSIQNLSQADLNNPVTLSFYYSSDSLLDGLGNEEFLSADTISKVLSGGPFTIDLANNLAISSSNDLPNGPAYLIVEISQNDDYTDCNLANNTANIPFELVYDILPVLDPIGSKEVDEGQPLHIHITSSDVDGDYLYLYYFTQYTLSGEVSFKDNNDGTADFDWTPAYDAAGQYFVTFTVYDRDKRGGNYDQEEISIIVNNVNRPPVLDSIGPQTFIEKQYKEINVTGSDPDNDDLEFTASGVPAGANFTFFNGWIFSWAPNGQQSGTYYVTFYVYDGTVTDSEQVEITVEDVPCADLTIASLSLDDPQEISFDRHLERRLNLAIQNIGETGVDDDVSIAFYVSEDSSVNCDCNIDPIGQQIVSTVPLNGPIPVDLTNEISLASEGSNFGNGPAYLCAVIDPGNDYDDCNISNNYVCIPVNIVYNIAPILDFIGDKVVNEGQTLSFVVKAFDPDEDPLYLDYYYYDPSESIDPSFVDSGNGHGYFEWTPKYDESGAYEFTFYADDNQKSSDQETITITVNNVNRPPAFNKPTSDQSVLENNRLEFFVSADDPDFDNVHYELQSPDLPLDDINFDGYAKGLGYFDWTPNFSDAGIYTAVFRALDDSGAVGFDTVMIMVGNLNAPPQFEEIPFQLGSEDSLLSFQIRATDVDGNLDSIYIGTTLPLGATFTYNHNGTGTFSWTPDCNQGGEYPLTCYAVDDSGAVDTGHVGMEILNSCDVQLTVINTPCLQCAPPQNYTDILIIDNHFSIEFNNQVDPYSLEENITLHSARGSQLNYQYNSKNRSIDIYPRYGDFSAVDTIMVTLSSSIYDLDESSLDSTYHLVYLVGPAVYPGDCNNDGTVDEIDVLSIGLYWNNAGPERDFSSEQNPLDFYAQPAHFQQFGKPSWNPGNGVYADVDGSGVVDAQDLCGIAANFGLTVDKKNAGAKTDGIAGNNQPAVKNLEPGVLQQMRAALIECPESAPKSRLLEIIDKAIKEASPTLPTTVELYQNYPNPFNPSTTIEFYLPKAEQAKLAIYNLLGQQVVTLVDDKLEAGYKTIHWHGTDSYGNAVASGIYFYKLNTETIEINKRMLLLK